MDVAAVVERVVMAWLVAVAWMATVGGALETGRKVEGVEVMAVVVVPTVVAMVGGVWVNRQSRLNSNSIYARSASHAPWLRPIDKLVVLHHEHW